MSGSFAFADGSRYVGEWAEVDGAKVRQGNGKFEDGVESYEGGWVKDKMEGSGIFRAASGASFEGEFKDGKYHGEGRYQWSDGAHYEGGWREGKMHGEGCYTDSDGVAWSGQFYNGKFFNGKAYLALRS